MVNATNARIGGLVISVVTVAFNEEASVGATLQSIVCQDWPDRELIFIDGGSTDSTVESAAPYRAMMSHFVSEPDDGIYDAMNKGLALASGDLVCFMNAGDVFASNFALSAIARSVHDRDACHLSRAMVEGRGALFFNPPLDRLGESWVGRVIPSHQSTFYPRRFAASERYDTRFGSAADSDYTFRCMSACGWEFHDLVTSHFRLGGASNRFDKWGRARDAVTERVRIVASHRGWFTPLYRVVYTSGPVLAYLIERLAGRRHLSRLRSLKGGGKWNAGADGD